MYKYKIIICIFFILTISQVQGINYHRGLDINMGFGYTLPFSVRKTSPLSGRILNRLGLSYELSGFSKNSTLNLGLLLSTRSIKFAGDDPFNNWTLTLLGFQSAINWKPMPISVPALDVGLSLIPQWVTDFQIHGNEGTINAMNDAYKLQIDLDVFLRLNIAKFGVRAYYNWSFLPPAQQTKIFISSFGCDFLIPITKLKKTNK